MRVALVELVTSERDYGWDWPDLGGTAMDFQEISDADYQVLQDYINQGNYSRNGRKMVLIVERTPELPETLASALISARKQLVKAEEERVRRQVSASKAAATRKDKTMQKKKELLAKLKEELGEP